METKSKIDFSQITGENTSDLAKQIKALIENGYEGAIDVKAQFKAVEVLAKELDPFLNEKIPNELTVWGKEKPIVNGFVVEIYQPSEKIYEGEAAEFFRSRLEKAKEDYKSFCDIADTIKEPSTVRFAVSNTDGEVSFVELETLPCKKIPKGTGIKFTRVSKR